MMNNLNPHKLLFRDGTSQQNRNHEPLQPGHVQIEGRSMEELIAEAQRLAKELRFFDENNQPLATWESFLVGDAEAYHKKSETQKKIQREQWAAQLAAYVEDPDYFLDDQKTKAILSRPHTVLFMTFLKLLNHIKSQINGLTQKHLDFYFRDYLGLTPKGAVPDVVNVLLELVENNDQLEVKKGTVLLAGTDKDGNELHYKTDEDAIISRAKIAGLKTIFADKKTVTIEKAHKENADAFDQGFTAMMEMALGSPNPGDALPELPTGIQDMPAVYTALQTATEEQPATEEQQYVTEQLFLSVEDFEFIIQKHLEDLDTGVTDWQQVYDILDRAFKDKIKNKRQQALKAIHENDGFEELLKQVYGDPLPGDDLPLYRGNPPSLEEVHNDMNPDSENRQEALDYIFEELKLDQEDFTHIVQTNNNTNAGEEAWTKVYKLLELADRQIRSVTLPSPMIEKLPDVYASPDAKATAFSQYGDEEESVRFKTFGSKQPGVHQALQPANIGFAMSSPVLLLKEGKRQITALIDFGENGHTTETLPDLFNKKGFLPFQIWLTSEKEWFRSQDPQFTFGNYLGTATEGTYNGTLNNQTLTITEGDNFDTSDIGKYLVFPNGTIYKITAVEAKDEVKVQEAGNTDSAFGNIVKFLPGQVYLNAMKVTIDLSEDDLPVVPFEAPGKTQHIRPRHPALVFSLKHIPVEQAEEKSYLSYYEDLMHLKMHKVRLSVNVEGMKKNTLQNDQNTIDPKKPFDPFGFEPETGSNFYITNEEIAQKKLDTLELKPQWIKLPKDLKEHYKNYWHIEANDPDLAETSYQIKGNNDFKAQVFLHHNHVEVPITDIELFPTSGKASIQAIPDKISAQSPTYNYKNDPDAISDDEDVVEWDRYFRLELDPIDFQHTIHNTLFNSQALSENPQIKSLKINAPYQPKLKSLQVGYASHTDIFPGEADTTSPDKLYHIHPFGFEQLRAATPDLFPSYEHQGTLYLGISQLETPQILSVLFQMAAGSANPDVEKPDIQWSYLRENEWVLLEKSAIISDTTNGLINTGIVRIKIPADATTGGTLMPDELSWIKAGAINNIDGISDTIDIMAQAVSATLSNEVAAPSHFEGLLAAETITETLEPFPEIKSITQPFTSRKGKPAEKGNTLYKRLSERLRHKNRALTMWDYEHMVLNEFPQVYKVKCLPSVKQIGKVNVIVIPDIKGSLPFNPFAPKVAADTLFQIHRYLDSHSPVHAEVAVQNPFYLQVKTRCTVKFHKGFDEGFYKAKLIDEIKHFLAPWAYDERSEITIGGTLHASVLINFIAERPYIDYVANMKLFQSEDGKKFTDVRTLNDGKTIVSPSRPDTIMVSAQSHEIDIADENEYNEDDFEGIDYMKVELDFIVGEDLN